MLRAPGAISRSSTRGSENSTHSRKSKSAEPMYWPFSPATCSSDHFMAGATALLPASGPRDDETFCWLRAGCPSKGQSCRNQPYWDILKTGTLDFTWVFEVLRASSKSLLLHHFPIVNQNVSGTVVRAGRLFQSAPALEHRDIELAKSSRISDDLHLRDPGVREGEGQCPRQLSRRCEDQSD